MVTEETRDTDSDESLVEAMGQLDSAIRAKQDVTRVTTNLIRDVIAEFIAYEVAGRPDHYVSPSPEMYDQTDDLLGELHAAGFHVVPVPEDDR